MKAGKCRWNTTRCFPSSPSGRTDRAEAIARLRRALGEYEIQGIQTNVPFFRRVLEHPDFVAGRLDTGFIDRVLAAGLMEEEPPSEDEERVALLAALLHVERNRGSAPVPSNERRWMEAGRTASLTRAAARAVWREVAMKFDARLHRGSESLEHEVELMPHETVERRAPVPSRQPDRRGPLRGNHPWGVLGADGGTVVRSLDLTRARAKPPALPAPMSWWWGCGDTWWSCATRAGGAGRARPSRRRVRRKSWRPCPERL